MRTKHSFRSQVLSACAALVMLAWIAKPVGATSFTWNTPVTGNWTDAAKWNVGSGNPDDISDEATISATGSSYTVTLDANKSIGEFAISSADASMVTGGNSLTVDGDGATTTNPGNFSHSAGTLDGTYLLHDANVDLTNVVSNSASTFSFFSKAGSGPTNISTFDVGSNHKINSNQTLKFDMSLSHAAINVNTSTAITNEGTVQFDHRGQNNTAGNITWTLAGTLTNDGTVTLNAFNTAGTARPATIDADVANSATGLIELVQQSASAKNGLVFSKTAATHTNSGDINIDGPTGLTIVGNGTSLTQSTGGATLDVTKLKLGTGGTSPDTIQNTFSVTAGSLSGFFTLAQTAATLGAGVTLNAPTTFKFDGETLNSFTGDVPVDLTLELHTIGTSEGAIVSTPGSVVNNGTISILSTGAGFNSAFGQLNIGAGGTLTNNGTITADTQVSSYGLTANTINANVVNNSILDLLVTNNHATQIGRTVLTGDLTNESGGTLTVNVTGTGPNKEVRFSDGVSGTYINRGTFNVEAGLLNLNGGTLDNESTGTLGGNGTLAGIVDNDGTISPGLSAGILTVNGSTQFNAGSQLVIEITGSGAVAGTDFDQLIVSGAVTGLTNADLVVNIGSGLDLGDDVFTILTTSSDLTGLNFDSVTFNGPGDTSYIGTVTYGNGFVQLSEIGSVPEPSSGVLLALAGMVVVRRRRKR